MENTPAKISADILSAAIAANRVYIEKNSAESIAAVYTVLHEAVHEAAKKDYAEALSNANIR